MAKRHPFSKVLWHFRWLGVALVMVSMYQINGNRPPGWRENWSGRSIRNATDIENDIREQFDKLPAEPQVELPKETDSAT